MVLYIWWSGDWLNYTFAGSFLKPLLQCWLELQGRKVWEKNIEKKEEWEEMKERNGEEWREYQLKMRTNFVKVKKKMVGGLDNWWSTTHLTPRWLGEREKGRNGGRKGGRERMWERGGRKRGTREKGNEEKGCCMIKSAHTKGHFSLTVRDPRPALWVTALTTTKQDWFSTYNLQLLYKITQRTGHTYYHITR